VFNFFEIIAKHKRHHLFPRLEVDNRSRIYTLLAYLLAIISLHILAMVVFEQLPIDDAIWLTLTTITTVGYGDLSAQTAVGRTATTLLLYFGGIFILAKIAGDYFDYRLERKQKMITGLWRWHMQKHIVIINAPSTNPEQYFLRLIQQFRDNPAFVNTPIQCLTDQFPNGLPSKLRALDILHFHGLPESQEMLDAVNANQAEYIIILATDENNYTSDSQTFDILHRLVDSKARAKIVVECLNDDNRNRLLAAGAQSVLRPIRAYPELIVRAVVAPGSERVLEHLFTHSGNYTQRYDIQLEQRPWAEVVSTLIHQNLGIALAYLDAQGELFCNPQSDQKITSKAIFVLVREQDTPSITQITQSLMIRSC